jgi:hypothetical protein
MRPDLIEYQKMMMAQNQNPNQQYAPAQMPPMAQAQQPQQQAFGNPIHSGTLAGMEAARNSIGMDAHDRQRAMGNAMLRFFGNMGKTGHGPGFSGALSAINSSFLPAVEGFQGHENGVEEKNYSLLKNQLDQQNKMEKMAFEKKIHDDLLKKQKLDYELEVKKAKTLESYYSGKLKGKGGNAIDGVLKTEYGDIDLSQYPTMSSQATKTLYAKKYAGLSNVSKDLSKIKGSLNNLTKITKDNVISPLGSTLGSYPNMVKDYIGKMDSDTDFIKDIKKETLLRQSLESQFARLEPVLERMAKEGVPGEQLLTRFHELKVYLNSAQPAYIIRDRVNELSEDIDSQMQAAKLSLLTGRQIPHLPKQEEKEESFAQDAEAVKADAVEQSLAPEAKQALISDAKSKFPFLTERGYDDAKTLRWAIRLRERGLYP